jgi:hypothetical protein
VASALAELQENQNNPVNPENPASPVQKSATEEQKDFTPNQTFVYDEGGNGPSLRSRPAKWLRFGDTAIAARQWLHDASRKYTWDADIHLTSVTTEGHREALRIEEPGTTGAAPGGATGSVAFGQASGLPLIALQNAPSKTTSTTPQLDTENFKLETRYVWGEDLSGSLQGAGGIGGQLRSTLEQSPTKNQEPRAKSQEPRAKSQEPRAKSQEPRAKSQEPRAKSQEPRAKSQEPRTKNQEPRTKNQEPRTVSATAQGECIHKIDIGGCF